jgi:PAS domain-containing protein
MKHALDLANEHITVLLAIATGLTLLIPKVRELIGILARRGRQWVGGNKLDILLETSARVESRLIAIEKELNFNGGRSSKDMLFLLAKYREHDFWRIGRPAIEMDETAQVNLVSEAACRLFCVNNPQDLYRRSWLRFIASDQVDEFLRAYEQTANYASHFVYRLHIHCQEGHDRGEWELRASPISPEDSSRKLYSGYLSPVCEKAKSVAREVHWAQ